VKICWDNLEKIKYRPDKDQWQNKKQKSNFYIYKENCLSCGEPFLFCKNLKTNYCSHSCVRKGKKLSEEHKRKIGDAVRADKNGFYGKKHTLETKALISKTLEGKNFGNDNHFFGKKHTVATKKKIGEANKKYVRTKEYRLKMSIATSGEKNGNWKGGLSCEPYCDVWLDKEYKESIKERDGYKCLNPDCTKQHTKLHLHHIDYDKKNCKPENLITICNSCNSRANFDREWHSTWYQALINKRYGGK